MIGEVVIAIREALEPEPSDVNKYLGRRRPWQWKPNYLYVYPIAASFEQVGTDPSCLRLNFTLQAVYVVNTEGEEAQQERYERIDDVLDAKVTQYINTLSTRTGIPHNINLSGYPLDNNFFSDLDESGVALQISGYRLP